MQRILKLGALVTSLFVALAGAAYAQSASPNDTARFLAGLAPSADSPLAPLTRAGAWQSHARRFDSIFGSVDSHQLSHIRAWSKAKLTSPSPVLFYMFSGPDFLYANAFFPDASTYVMAGLEPPGTIPDLTRSSRGGADSLLYSIEGSLRSIVAYSFFQTKEMRHELVKGTLPILYVFLARSGKTIHDVTLIRLDDDGQVASEGAAGSPNSARGVKITFAGSDGRERTLYYFGTNIANDGFKASGLAKFMARLGTGDALIKSASYLPHDSGFSDVRNFLLTHARLIVQDDTGVPVRYFAHADWQLRPFGHYIGPLGIFPGKYQSQLSQLFGHAEPINFGIGYHWRPQSSNLLLAAKTQAAVARDAAASPSEEAQAVSAPQVARGTQQVLEEPASTADLSPAETDGEAHKTAARKHTATHKHAERSAHRTRSHGGYASYRFPQPFYWYGR
jgi:hypothetical protein